MVDDEHSIAELRARQWDPLFKCGVPLLVGLGSAAGVMPMARAVGGAPADGDSAALAFLILLQMIPFVALVAVERGLGRRTVIATTVLLAVATIWMQYVVETSESSTAVVAYVVFPIELCVVPVLALGGTVVVRVLSRAFAR